MAYEFLKWDIEFVIQGNPKSLKRHRTFRRGDFVGSYDPSKNDKRDFLVMALKYRPEKPLEEPLLVKFTFAFPRPKSHFRTGSFSDQLKPNAPKWHTGIPDADNLIKFIADALNGQFWKDDKFICECVAEKKYDPIPHIRVQIYKLIKKE